jgi:hypothetical protein
VPPDVEQITQVPAPADVVWERATSPEGINHELSPILRMTMPRGLSDATIDDVVVGEPLGRAWILLFGFLPVDYDDLSLVELEPGHRFLERSSMLSMRVWQHERRVAQPEGDTRRVTDRLSFEPRRPLAWIPGSQRLAGRSWRSCSATAGGASIRRGVDSCSMTSSPSPSRCHAVTYAFSSRANPQRFRTAGASNGRRSRRTGRFYGEVVSPSRGSSTA